MFSEDKENKILSSNLFYLKQTQPTNKKERKMLECSSQDEQMVRKDPIEKVRIQVYTQHKKNKELYERIISKNSYFTYDLLSKGHHHRYEIDLARQHESLLQEESFLLKQLTKIQCMETIITQNNPFEFMIDVWNRHPLAEQTSQQTMDRLNKNVSFLKTNLVEIAKQSNRQHMTFSNRIIIDSKEYKDLKRTCQNLQSQNKELKQQMTKQEQRFKEQIGKQSKQKQNLYSEKAKIQTKLAYYEDKTKELLSKVTELSQELADKERKYYESTHKFAKRYESIKKTQDNRPFFQINIKLNDQSYNQRSTIRKNPTSIISIDKALQSIIDFLEENCEKDEQKSLSFVHSSVISQISFESLPLDASEDKENNLSDLLNNMNSQQDHFTPYSTTKKPANRKNRLLLNSHCKERSKLFDNTTFEVDPSKVVRFVRHK